jgi:phosphatidylethanolamine/phosphatidyl-N-methylethanolamine N-methyltransferase
MNNTWNQFIYKIWAPFYDKIFNTGMFLKARQNVFMDVQFKPAEKVLFAGVGTGADLAFLPSFPIEVYAIDYSREMLKKCKNNYSNQGITFIRMDAQELSFEENTFDKVIAGLILSVVPHPEKALKEMLRVLKPGGQIIIFDKFLPKDKRLSIGKSVLKPIIRALGTDISVSFEKLAESTCNESIVKKDVPIMLNGMYRYIVLEKK